MDASRDGRSHRLKRAYYPQYNFFYGPTTPYQQQQQMRRNTIYPSYFMEPAAQSYYPEYNMQQQQGFARSFQQQPFYEQTQYQAPATSYNAVPFSGTVTPNKRTLYSSFNANPITSSIANSIKRYDTLSIQKPIKMINIPFKEKTNLFFRKHKPTPTQMFSHKRRHNATAHVKTVINSDEYKDRGIIKRINMLIKSFHKASGMDSKELKNSSSKTMEDSEMRQPIEYEEIKANRRHNAKNITEEDTFEIEDPSDKKASKKDSSDDQKKDHSKKIEGKVTDTTNSKKNQTRETDGEMNVFNVDEADQPKIKNISTASPTQRHFLSTNTKKRNKSVSNSTKLTRKLETHPKKSPNDKLAAKSSGLEKITEEIKDTWNGMADEAVKLIKGDPKNDNNKAEEVKKEDQKLKQLLTTSIKQQEARLTKDVTGEDIYDPKAIKIVNPEVPHAMSNDALHGDWFDTAREPSEKTKNDIKMSSDVLSAISNAKMRGKNLEDIQVTKPESKKQYESRVKTITNLAESTENDILSGLIQGSLGDAMPDKKPLKMKNIERFMTNNKSPEKTDVGNIQKLLSKYNDDFDVFVDKTVDNHLSAQPGVGKVVKQVNTLMDILPENEQNNALLPSEPPSDVTGKKKNFNGHTIKAHKNKNIALIDSNEDDDDTLMKRLSEKWKMFKEANKDVLDGSFSTNHRADEPANENTSLKSKLSATNTNTKGKDILNRYFDQVEVKQAMDKSKELESRQTKRKERLKSTLHMISDIEQEIDSLVNKDTVNAGGDSSNDSMKQTTESETEKKQHKRKKGKAEIFKELTRTDNEENVKQTPQGVGYLKETPSSYLDEQQQQSETATDFNEPDTDEEEQDQPQNYMATPQYENPTGKNFIILYKTYYII